MSQNKLGGHKMYAELVVHRLKRERSWCFLGGEFQKGLLVRLGCEGA